MRMRVRKIDRKTGRNRERVRKIERFDSLLFVVLLPPPPPRS